MGYQDVPILRDAEGNPIPQYYNPVTGQFEPLTGSNGAQDTRLSGSNVEDGLPVKTTGDIVEQFTIIEGVTITDLNSAITDTKDLKAYREVYYYIRNTHDEDIRIRPYFQGSHWQQYDLETNEWKLSSQLEKPFSSSFGQRQFINDYLGIFLNIPMDEIAFNYRAIERVPTSGTLSIYGLGVK